MHHTIQKKEKSSLPKIGFARGPHYAFASDPHLGVDGPQDFGCARAGEIFYFFLYFDATPYHRQKKKKLPPTNRVRAQTPTDTSPPAPLISFPATDAVFRQSGVPSAVY